MSHASEGAAHREGGEDSELLAVLTVHPRCKSTATSQRMPSLVPEDTEVETFPTAPRGPQMENEDQPWHVLPSLRLSRVGGQCRSCKELGRLISFTETALVVWGGWARGSPCPVVALTQSQPTGPEVQGGLNFAVCLVSVPQPPAAQLLVLAPTPSAQSKSLLASPSPSCLHIASLVFQDQTIHSIGVT